MKNFKFLAVALVAMLGFSACEKDCDHDFIEVDYSKELVGTWTCRTADFAEALVIKADGSIVSTGYHGAKFWEDLGGRIVVENGNVTLTFEDDVTVEGHFDIIPGMAFSILQDNGARMTFNYCKEDLSDEIIGMWVANNGPMGYENDMVIQTYKEDGYTIKTGWSDGANDFIVNNKTNYKVVGDLVFFKRPSDMVTEEITPYVASNLIYTPNGTSLGDILTITGYIPSDKGLVEVTGNFLRIKQSLELPGMKYDYIKTFVTNVKGLDKDIEFMGTTFNFAKMNSVKLDKMLKTLLFAVEFPDANTIRYSGYYNGENIIMEAPIVVDGNKMTVKMSSKNAALKDVDLYTFQDQDNTQMHMYMHSTGFVNFFGNMQVTVMEQMDLIDTTDAAAVKAVFDSIDEAVETINLSLVMTKAK